MIAIPRVECDRPASGPAGGGALAELFGRTLVLAPHPDDECFVYGLLARLRGLGCAVRVAVAAVGGQYQAHAGRVVPAAERLAELRDAADVGGLGLGPVGFAGCDARLDTVPLAEVVGWVEGEVRRFRPTAVLVPVPSHHQDHRVVYEAALAALRPDPARPVRFVALYEYPCSAAWPPPYAGGPLGRMVIDVSGDALEAKLAALARYASQVQGRPAHHPLHPDSVRRLAAWRGVEAGVAAAEVLYPLRIVL
jgi:LmbE family N-acetylglucosaminyl deacetylase